MTPRFKADEKAEPSHREPDLVLWFDHTHFNKNQFTIDELHRGDKIQFRGSIERLRINLS